MEMLNTGTISTDLEALFGRSHPR